MANFFDQFDHPQEKSGNFFDQFDTPGSVATAAPPAPAPTAQDERLQSLGVDTQAPEDSTNNPQVQARMKRFEAWAQKPLLSPEYTKPVVRAVSDAMTFGTSQMGRQYSPEFRGMESGAAEAAAGLSSPMNLGMLPLGVAGKLGQVVLGSAFEAQAIRAFPAMWEQFKSEPDPEKKAQLLTTMVIGLGLPAMAPFYAALSNKTPKGGEPETLPPPSDRQSTSTLPPSEVGELSVGDTTSRSVPVEDIQRDPLQNIGQRPSPVSTPVQEALQPDLARVQPQDVPQVTQDPLAPQLGAELPTEEIVAALKQRGFSPDEVEKILKEKFGREETSRPESSSISPTQTDSPRPSQSQPEPLPELVSQGASPQSESVRQAEEIPPDQSRVSQPEPTESTGIAQRTYDEAAKAGKLTEPIEPGEGISWQDSVTRGRDLLNNGTDPQMIVRRVQRTGRISADDMSVLRAERERLFAETNKAARAVATDPRNPALVKALNDARQVETDWIKNAVKPAQTEWHRLGMAQQGEAPVDFSTFEGMRRAIVDAKGKDIHGPEIQRASQRAESVRRAQVAEADAFKRLADESERKLPKTRTPSLEELRAEMERMAKDLTPCP